MLPWALALVVIALMAGIPGLIGLGGTVAGIVGRKRLSLPRPA